MPTYIVKCDTCESEFEGNSYNIDMIITDHCNDCGGDVCSNCVAQEWHKDCKEDEGEG